LEKGRFESIQLNEAFSISTGRIDLGFPDVLSGFSLL